MCGIAGLIGDIDGRAESVLGAMLDQQVHRGPDDSGTYRSSQEQGVLFGFRRLAVLDVTSNGHQPMRDVQNANVVVFNGEIYNFQELRRELEAQGDVFRSTSDTEVLLRAYARYGAGVVDRLCGMFAFAIHDPRQHSVLLARDRLGIKPLYYATVSRDGCKTLVFASEVRSMLASGLYERHIDPVALNTYLWNGYVVGPNTIVKGVSLLTAGTTMTVDVATLQTRTERYWSLGPRSPMPAEHAKAELAERLLVATRQHLVSDVPLGVFLSGGVDSGAVASLATRAGSNGVKTFHIGFDESDFDESPYARRVAQSLHSEHFEFRLTQSRFTAQLNDSLASIDQPTFDFVNTYFVSRVVKEAGITVALAGTGGDELFGGYSSFRHMPIALRGVRSVNRLPAATLQRVFRESTRLLFGRSGRVLPQTRWAKLGDLLATRGELVGIFQTFYALFTRDFLAELSSAEVASTALEGLPESRRLEFERVTTGLSPLAATGCLELGMFVGERLLRDCDAASMAVSLELRVPLLDHRVVEAAQQVPDSLRFHPLGRKRLLRDLAMPNLDPSIFNRPKSGFVLPISMWAKDTLADEIESTFGAAALVESVGMRPNVLQDLWRSFVAGAPGLYWSRVWAPYVLLWWCRRHGMTL